MSLTTRPEVQAAVDAMPPLRPEQIARLRQILYDWPERIAESVERHQRERTRELPAADAARHRMHGISRRP
ncbi:hypothetical protein GCM10010151_57590 [Actinoallomurus spadix]|uniref:Uncharacterized protein n=1 Tax=Actinoallomurus spadix TaxID=79912 RepID=A0ABP3H6A0_9ACTN